MLKGYSIQDKQIVTAAPPRCNAHDVDTDIDTDVDTNLQHPGVIIHGSKSETFLGIFGLGKSGKGVHVGPKTSAEGESQVQKVQAERICL